MPVHGRRSAPVRARWMEWIAFLTFTVLTTVVARHHEPWHDELQAWRLAIDSADMATLARNIRYEGHPFLFYALLHGLGLLSRSWEVVAAAHVAVACLTALIVLRFAPFPLLQRVLVVSGYFFFYEYAVITRAYGLGVLFAMLACVFWRGRLRVVMVPLMLFALANTSVVGLVLAMAMAMAFTIELHLGSGDRWWAHRAFVRTALISAASISFVAGSVAWQVMPPRGAPYRGGNPSIHSSPLAVIGQNLAMPASVIIPLAATADDGGTRWGAWGLAPTTRAQVIASDVVAGLIVLAGLYICARRRAALLLWSLAVIGLLTFFTFFHGGGLRHHGYLAIALVAGAWVAYGGEHEHWRGSSHEWSRRLDPWRSWAFTILLAPMVLASVQLGLADVREEFADAAAVSRTVRNESMRASTTVLGVAWPWSQGVAALLGEPLDMPVEQRRTTWIDAGRVRRPILSSQATDSIVQDRLLTNCRVLVITREGLEQSAWLKAHAVVLDDRPRLMPMSGTRLQLLRVDATDASRCHGGP